MCRITYNAGQLQAVRDHCPVTCGLCGGTTTAAEHLAATKKDRSSKVTKHEETVLLPKDTLLSLKEDLQSLKASLNSRK